MCISTSSKQILRGGWECIGRVELQFNVTMAGTLLTTVAVRKGDETPVLGSPFFGTAAAAAAAVLRRSTVTGPGTVMARVGEQATVAVSLFDAFGNRLTYPSLCAGVSLRFFHGVGAHANEPGLEVREFPSKELRSPDRLLTSMLRFDSRSEVENLIVIGVSHKPLRPWGF
jgi:hypothetical protein